MGVISHTLWLKRTLNSSVDCLKNQGESGPDAHFQKDKKYRPNTYGETFKSTMIKF